MALPVHVLVFPRTPQCNWGRLTFLAYLYALAGADLTWAFIIGEDFFDQLSYSGIVATTVVELAGHYTDPETIWLFLGEIEQVGGACLSGAMVGMIYYLVVRKVSERACKSWRGAV